MRVPTRPALAAGLCGLALLAGCAPGQTGGAGPAPGVVAPGPDRCGAAGLQGLVGQPAAVTGRMDLPAGTRVIGPDQAITSDYRPGRLNIETGRDGRIARIGCY